ncbi:ankyrin [Flagelloscypha sp. PMI_526]|nr:ankyrin [Flagelloscypha sp. PMI_526]
MASEEFQAAATYLSSASSLSGTATSTKLELYALFKIVTVSERGPETSRPSIFDPTGRAKWDAWKKASGEYGDTTQAERRYLEIARSLGWTPGAVAEDDQGGSESKDQSGGGMGLGVSTLSIADEKSNDDGTLHGATVDNNLTSLRSLLGTVDVNARDEYGYTALHLAADRGHVEAVQLLLQHGADPTALVTSRIRHVIIVLTLFQDPDEMTAEQLAEIAGKNEIVEALKSVRK